MISFYTITMSCHRSYGEEMGFDGWVDDISDVSADGVEQSRRNLM
jgi:hypothetical protein